MAERQPTLAERQPTLAERLPTLAERLPTLAECLPTLAQASWWTRATTPRDCVSAACWAACGCTPA
ncbi:MAG: hypothetical protein Q8Q09_10960 [Deltaproteobacteria bacterium]|nr:hypothetical protein [Deltaproteobacteria bacterium]